jgi:hypothetical protein
MLRKPLDPGAALAALALVLAGSVALVPVACALGAAGHGCACAEGHSVGGEPPAGCAEGPCDHTVLPVSRTAGANADGADGDLAVALPGAPTADPAAVPCGTPPPATVADPPPRASQRNLPLLA